MFSNASNDDLDVDLEEMLYEEEMDVNFI